MSSPPAPPPPSLRLLLVVHPEDEAPLLGTLSTIPNLSVLNAKGNLRTAWRLVESERPAVLLIESELLIETHSVFLRMLRVRHPIPILLLGREDEPLAPILPLAGGREGLTLISRAAPSQLAGQRLAPEPEVLLSAVAAALAPWTAGDTESPSPAGAAPPPAPPALPKQPPSLPEAAPPLPTRVHLIVIGSSAGGPEALRILLERLPAQSPPILIAQHMPAGFTRSFAERLDGLCRLNVTEAKDGEPIHPGMARIAPGGFHLEASLHSGTLKTEVHNGPPVNGHRPSVEVLFQSAARIMPRRTVAVLLTGMGADGAEAMLELRQAGAHTVTESEESATVFGMPREAIRRDAAVEILHLDAISQRLASL